MSGMSENIDRLRIDTLKALLLEKPEYIDIIKAIIEAERIHNPNDPWLEISPTGRGFSPEEAGVEWGRLSYLMSKGIVARFGSKRAKRYTLLVDPEEAKNIIAGIETAREVAEPFGAEEEELNEIPDDLFDPIIGHDRIKRVVMKSLKAKEPVHILLIGDAGTGKTLFLRQIKKLKGAKYYSGGGRISKVGLIETLIEYKPRYLLIDELENIPAAERSILLDVMEFGTITYKVHNKEIEFTVKTKVYSAINPWDESKLPRDLLDRFLPIRMPAYSDEEFIRVVTEYCAREFDTDRNVACYLAEKLLELGHKSVRMAINIAKMVETKEDVDDVISVIFQ